MATKIKGTIIRELAAEERGKPLVAKITVEGVYLKRKGERWESAVLCPWEASYSAGCKIKAIENNRGKQIRRVSRGLL